MHFSRKNWGRIYVEKQSDIAKVKLIIKELDEFEFSYLPENLITTFDEYPRVEYTHKFTDMDMDTLIAICWDRGIKIWAFDAGYEFPSDARKLLENKEPE